MKSAVLLRSGAAVLLGAVVLTGCGDDKKDDQKADQKSSGAPSSAAGGSAAPATGDAPKKIVSLAPTATEMLYAIGAGKQVVAVDDQSNFPADAPKTALSGFKPNVEAITKYAPDMVVITNDTDGVKAQLEKVKIKVVELPAAKTFDDMYAQFNTLGTATGHAKEAADVTAKMKKDIADVVAKTKKPAKPLTYFHEVDSTGYSATSKTFIGQVYALFGLQNIADPADKDGSGYPQVSTEYIVQANPDLVFLADSKCCQQDAAAVAKRPGWDKTKAVQANGVVALDDDIASRWGPRVVDLVAAVGAAVEKAGATG
ncbi:ABC transporter substrate-binding protein [Yinghuangia seranimata]|uniref:ABC transporter substrate-binding protein n=1 Tax=Yinghuangia seranimata TaxID=408067 RepID=UPI00248BAF1F|nr:ABC transporter substrate-binding protein [Yinghuangia seranimata]MDI2129238.1 ABC transporter substrate-binding protein [Yinghuangia seranimata]